jgi:hypothetical protein
MGTPWARHLFGYEKERAGEQKSHLHCCWFCVIFYAHLHFDQVGDRARYKGMDEYFAEDHSDALLHISRNGQVAVALVKIVGSVGSSMPA